MSSSEKATLDNTVDSKGVKLRDVLKSSTYKDEILGVWPAQYEKYRKDLIVLDHPSFPGHKWFQDFAALPKEKRTANAFLKEVNEFIRRRQHLFFVQPDKANHAKKSLAQFVKWVQETDRTTKYYSMDSAKTMVKMVVWIHKHDHVVKRKDGNKYQSRYDHIREHVGWWNRAMEVQAWYPFESHKRKKTNDAVRLSNDGDFALYRTQLHTKGDMFIKNTNKTIADARNIKKRMTDRDADKFVETFNALQAYGPRKTKATRMSALTHYAILAINHNLGFRGGQVRKFNYSWIMYEEVAGVVSGVFINMGNPQGHKVRNAMNWGSSQFIVRHIDVRQCPIGAMIKTIVALHDIIGDTSLLDQIDESIRAREAFVAADFEGTSPETPRWQNYKMIRNESMSYEPISSQLYGNVIKNTMQHIDARKVETIGHEPRNRVANKMLELGLSDDLTARFLGWSTGKETLFDKVYGLAKKHTVCALARAGYPGFKKKKVFCPREGEDEDFEDFEDLRKLVLDGRVAKLLKRAMQVNKALCDENYEEVCDDAAELFLELLDKYLIRVWIEDAAILQPRYPKSVCYEGHRIFTHPRWKELVDHLAELRQSRGETDALSPAPSEEIPMALDEEGDEILQQQDSPNSRKLHALMNEAHTDASIASLYVWRKRLDRLWAAMNEGNRGIPTNRWKDHMASRSLYHGITRIVRYIDNVTRQRAATQATNSQQVRKDIIDHLQDIADALGIASKHFADEHFRLMSLDQNSKEVQKKLTEQQRSNFKKALEDAGLPWPSEDLTCK